MQQYRSLFNKSEQPAKLSRKSDPITSQQSAVETEKKLNTLQEAMIQMFKVSLWPATANEAAKESRKNLQKKYDIGVDTIPMQCHTCPIRHATQNTSKEQNDELFKSM